MCGAAAYPSYAYPRGSLVQSQSQSQSQFSPAMAGGVRVHLEESPRGRVSSLNKEFLPFPGDLARGPCTHPCSHDSSSSCCVGFLAYMHMRIQTYPDARASKVLHLGRPCASALSPTDRPKHGKGSRLPDCDCSFVSGGQSGQLLSRKQVCPYRTASSMFLHRAYPSLSAAANKGATEARSPALNR